jgi:hypothetical protein
MTQFSKDGGFVIWHEPVTNIEVRLPQGFDTQSLIMLAMSNHKNANMPAIS